MEQKNYLRSHKSLSVWFDQIEQTEDQDFVSKIIYKFCVLLKEATQDDIKQISFFIDELSGHLSDHQTFFEGIICKLSSHNFDLYRFLTEICLSSFETSQSEVLYQSLCRLADLTKKDELLFLCAWMSFNLNHHSACLLWLRKIKHQTAQTMTLTGQVFLEMAEAEKALDYFERAVALDPSDTMSWFFLSKAAFCLDLYERSWEGMMNCQKRSPFHPEVAIFCAILSKKTSHKPWAKSSWNLLLPIFKDSNFSMDVAIHLIDLAIILEDKKKLEEIIFHIPWLVIKHRPDSLKAIASCLKNLGQSGYFDIAQMVLNRLV